MVDKQSEDDCWNWKGAKLWNGYGVVNRNGKNHYVHKYAYEITQKPVPDWACVSHSCENRLCCNPQHLILKRKSENKRQAPSQNRSQRMMSASELRNLHQLIEKQTPVPEILKHYSHFRPGTITEKVSRIKKEGIEAVLEVHNRQRTGRLPSPKRVLNVTTAEVVDVPVLKDFCEERGITLKYLYNTKNPKGTKKTRGGDGCYYKLI